MPHYRLQCDAGFSLSPFHKFYTPKWLTTTVNNTNNLVEARAEKESLCVDFKSKPIAFCIKILVHVQIEFVKNQRMPLKERKKPYHSKYSVGVAWEKVDGIQQHAVKLICAKVENY